MKKYYFLIIVALILGLVLTGCSLLSNISQVPANEQSGITYLTKSTTQAPLVSNLIADGRDQAIDVGDVLVWNNAEYLYVKYVITNSDWCLTETHLAVATAPGGIPQTKKNNPIPGQFPYQCCYDENEGKWLFMTKPEGLNAECSAEWSTETCLTAITYTIPLSEIDEGVEPEASLYIAAHAVVQNDPEIIDGDVEPPIYWTESAWGAGFEFSGKNWATYFTYKVQYEAKSILENKDSSWNIIVDEIQGTLEYNLAGPTFDFRFSAEGLSASTAYSLIYYADPYPGDHPGALIAVMTTDGDGNVCISCSIDLGMDLPHPSDANYSGGAKIWLVPSSHYDATNCKMVTFVLGKYLFDCGDLITYDDTDV